MTDGLGGLNSSMAGKTGIGGVQMLPDFIETRKVLAAIDGSGNDRRDVSELQMFFVAEVSDQRLRRRRDWNILVARLAGRRRREIIVVHPSAVFHPRVALGACEFELEVQPVRERTRLRSCQAGQQHCTGRNADSTHH